MNYLKKCEDFVAHSVSIDVSIDVTDIVQLPVFIPGAFTAGSYGGLTDFFF
jgi:hypothetical protein